MIDDLAKLSLFQEYRAEGREEGLKEGMIKGEKRGLVKGLREAVIQIIESRFPTLLSQAQPRIQKIRKTEELKTLMVQLLTASDEAAARVLLRLPDA
ncbi:MAG TPA: hypothetical protein VKR06_38405 [Ktedonosporobacter sp.]|nr:hypothetical protein [Ktedonosporobacter sp.]